ncbi:DUF2157 domain-containing protein [Rhodobacterales bacterium]|nr:DUF2157 domain-containing protein [Rhodobacterales bacterium]
MKDDLEDWVAKGWVSAQSAGEILRDQETGDGRSRLPLALAGIGMVCVALALFAFIAANWDAIPKSLKLAGIAVLVIMSHGLAAVAASRGSRGIADLLTGFATLVFVGGLSLVGQIFHLPADWAGGSVLICFGALAAAWLTGSRTSLIVVVVAAITWQVFRTQAGDPTWLAYVFSLSVLGAVFAHAILYPARISRWAAICLLWVTYGRWFIDTGDTMKEWNDAILVMGIAGCGALAVIMMQLDALADLCVKWSSGRPMRSHGQWLMARSMQDAGMLVLCAVLVFTLIIVPEISDDLVMGGLLEYPALVPVTIAVGFSVAGLLLSFKTEKALVLFAATAFCLPVIVVPVATLDLVILAGLTLAALVGLCTLATWYNNRFWMLCTYLALTAVALWLLQVTIGSLLGQSLFFLIAGIVLLGVALWLARIFRKSGKPPAASSDMKEVQP